ncbi:beta-glucosidase [Bifidobacterium lemurum]|uniref:Beta-glucosidase n=1 Tax=Bifidobacterium lemurum TaxID=1603886 RepID=A0A261FRD7_9BIFI|nr:family 1 glycosylhydrolase [Bifidobacterium lemurum]OZG61751.1 beta-glucosidase [Bifidobacterium lemurum]QOL34908.1 family 1 glycosylhydrolase [Bifidobacterium lemurum]
MTYRFPDGFTWGTATASYQVEGAIHEDGRTPSIWDTFCAEPGHVFDHSSGEFACDQYHRYPQDIALMKTLGIDAYRMSVSWSRIIPELGGPVNQAGVDHYLRVLDALRDNGIKPVVTLYHWDLPQYLQDRGGWPERDTALRYGEYAGVLARAFGDRVDTWTTLNEPWCAAYLGYGCGDHAPGIKDHAQALAAAHHLNLAHGLGVQAVRGELGDAARCSVTLNLSVTRAASDSPQDVAAKRRADLLNNEVFLGPMVEGRYDPELFSATEHVTDWSFVRDGDVETAHQPIDVLGVNYYSTNTVRWRDENSVEAVADDGPVATSPAGLDVHNDPIPAQESVETLPPTGELTAMGWNQDPQGLTDILVELAQRYPELELMVTENGSAWEDEVTLDPQVEGVPAGDDGFAVVPGKIVHDPQRVAYLDAHVKALAAAIDGGANVTGYYAWSLLDNFEWALGYTKRFGIVRVDYDTQERIWKDSALYYQRLVSTNGIPEA